MSYRGFPNRLVDAIVCQKCQGKVATNSKDEYIYSGQLTCKECFESYQIEDGILLMLPKQELDELRESEIKMRDETADNYDNRLDKRYQKEVVSTLIAIGDTSGKSIIEHGAGTGRLTMLFADKASAVLACDFSLQSLKVLAKKIDQQAIGLVHADATQIVTANDFFDLVVATQFYEHIPSKELRKSFLSHSGNTLKKGGRFISTTYHYDLRMRMKKQPQEGMHWGVTFFHYYTIGEIKEEFSKYFTITRIHPIDITLPFEVRLGLSKELGGKISIFCEHIPLLNLFGHLVLCVGRKK